jgi:hypothetical protein
MPAECIGLHLFDNTNNLYNMTGKSKIFQDGISLTFLIIVKKNNSFYIKSAVLKGLMVLKKSSHTLLQRRPESITCWKDWIPAFEAVSERHFEAIAEKSCSVIG